MKYLRGNRILILFAIGFLMLFQFSCKKEKGQQQVSKPNLLNRVNVENGILSNYYIDGELRQFMVYRPKDLPAKAPLVFVLHGFTQNAELFYNMGFNTIADSAKFAVCYPQGISTAWYVYSHFSKDVVFLKTLAEDLVDSLNLDKNRIFATGFSLGGAMCNLLALDAPETFKAVAPVAGWIFKSVWDTKPSAKPIPYFAIHGEQDNIVRISGYNPEDPAIQKVVDYYKLQNLCNRTDSFNLSINTKVIRSINLETKNEVWYYRIKKQGHVFPGDPFAKPGTDNSGFIANNEIWRFFRKW